MTAAAGDALSHAPLERPTAAFRTSAASNFLASDSDRTRRWPESGTSFHAPDAWRHEQSEGTVEVPSHSICTLLDQTSATPPMTLLVSTFKYWSS
jgi:hypothetical protein